MRALLLPLLTFTLIVHVFSYPSAPGTCNMNKMATLGHGPSQSTCDDCYGVEISTNSPHLVNIKVTGRFPYQGIVLLVKDKYTNKTLGEFQDYDPNLFTSVACDDDEDEQDKIEPDTIAVIGHIDAKWKNWPVTTGWNMVATKPVTELKLIGMVVIDYDNFHLLPETEFNIKRKVVQKPIISSSVIHHIKPTSTALTTTTAAMVSTVIVATATQTIIEVEHDVGTVVHQQTNALFIWVLTVFLSMYCLLSTCYRQLSKRRRRGTKMQDDEISLVASYPKKS